MHISSLYLRGFLAHRRSASETERAQSVFVKVFFFSSVVHSQAGNGIKPNINEVCARVSEKVSYAPNEADTVTEPPDRPAVGL